MDGETKMTNWDERFLALAAQVSTYSKDPSTKVGAVIVDSKDRVVSMGYNGLPRNLNDTEERLTNRELKLKLTLHAEVNAILFADDDLDSLTLYCTHPPCAQCACMIIQSGLRRVVWYRPTLEFEHRWYPDLQLTYQILHEAGVYYSTEVRPIADTSQP
jgi:dCMP deaminase